jgi:hypothetical protein
MSLFELDLQGSKFAIPKRQLFNFFDHHPELFNTANYQVASPVPVPVFEQFATSVASNKKLDIRQGTENDNYLRLLASEFCCEDLLVDDSSPPAPGELRSQEEQIEAYKNEIIAYKNEIVALRSRLSAVEVELRTLAQRLHSDPHSQFSAPPTEPKSLVPVETPRREGSGNLIPAGEDIIADLCQHFRGNAVDKGLVSVTMKSCDSPNSWASARGFLEAGNRGCRSRDEPGQWFCIDFQEMRVRLTRYSIFRLAELAMLSWVLELSLDGDNWTEIHRQTDVAPTRRTERLQFDVADCPVARFIRLTQTGPNAAGSHVMHFMGLRLSGTLLVPSQ